MKIMLIWPPLAKKGRIAPLLGLAYLASCLEKVGHNVKIIDSLAMRYTLKDVEKKIKNFDPDVVGISATTQFIYEAYSIARMSKENNPNCMTVLGGPHTTVLSRKTLEECNFIDIIIRGEGERTLLELLEKKKKEDLIGVRGISFRLNDKIIENPDRPFIEDLDSLPFPAYHLLPMQKYVVNDTKLNIDFFHTNKQPFGTITTSRGCPFNCSFCASNILWGRKWRSRSPENIIEELKILRNKYGLRKIFFVDDISTVKTKRIENLCKLIKEEGIDISWECPTRANIVTKDLCLKLKKAGCQTIGFGIESGVQKILDFLNKGITLELAEQAVKTVKNAGLQTDSNFMIGIPGETREMIKQTLAFAKKLDLTYTTFSILTPYPGTKIYEYVKKHNLLLTEDWSKYTSFNPVIRINGMSSSEIKGFFRKANLTFNFSPMKIIKNIKEIIDKKAVGKPP